MSRRVVITGISGGIGLAMARGLSAAGYDIIGLDLHEPRDAIEMCHFIKVDLRISKEIDETCQALRDSWSPFWAFVHCAGIYPITSFADYSLELWDDVHAVNTRSAFQFIKSIYSEITPKGRIVLVASGAAHIGSRDSAYSASKAGVVGLVRSLATNLAPLEILVNGICPGVIEAGMSARMSAGEINNYINRIPLRRLGTPDEVATCALFLLDEKNSYMTGATIDINGGLYAR